MALGGGTFTAQNKVLPGAYINFVSVANASSTLSERGICAIGLELDWGNDTELIELTNEDFTKHSTEILGYDYNHPSLIGLREIFKNSRKVYVYRLNGGGTKATNTYATSKCAGIRGNDLKIVIAVNADDENKFDVTTLLGTVEVDKQTVSDATGLIDNDYVTFKADATLVVTAGTALSGGTNVTVTATQHQALLDKLESVTFNVLGCASETDTIKTLYINYCKRMRDEMGKKIQVVVYNKAADYEGVVNVKNTVTDDGASTVSLVYYVTGLVAGTEVNKSASNKVYDGEYTINTNYTQAQLEAAITGGEFAFHKVGTEVRVLVDINSLTTTTDVKGDVFKQNQTIRVIDQIANDIAVIFNNKYLGKVSNNNTGRISLWTDIVKHHKELETIRAIENFSNSDVTVEQGNTKTSVVVNDAITVVYTMEKLYMTVTIN